MHRLTTLHNSTTTFSYQYLSSLRGIYFYHHKRFNSKNQRLHLSTLCTQRPRSLQYLILFYLFCLWEGILWDIWHGLGYGYTLKRINVCITAFFVPTFDISDFWNEATAGKGLDWHWIPEGGGPYNTTTTNCNNTSIIWNFLLHVHFFFNQNFFFGLHSHSLATYILKKGHSP